MIMVHKCLKETEFALYNKTQMDMVEEIKEIKEDIKNINYWIEVIKWMFSDMRLNFTQEKQELIEAIKSDVKSNYASKADIENTQKDVNFLKKSLWSVVSTILLAIVVAIMNLVIKK